jgi:predicted GNAT family acetyltransferase
MDRHPLDRPVWNALTTRQADLACGDARALRFEPSHGPFAAAADASPGSLAALGALVPAEGQLWTVEAEAMPTPAGVVAVRSTVLHQMVAAAVAPPAPAFDIVRLTENDAPAMLALATLTKPGPFFARTHRLGGFVGVKQDGRLVAMAGERMKADGFTEVSGVCTHPDHRGRGYAAALMRSVSHRILDRGESPFLHVYPDNAGAIALYEALGFRLRRPVAMTILARA